MHKLLLAIIASFSLVATPALAGGDPPSHIGSTRPVQVDAVDGDTIKRNGVNIRIIGLDTPELHRPRCEKERQAAIRARDRMAELGRNRVTIEVATRRDRYGRPLAIVRDRTGRDVAEIMIAEGHGRAYSGRGPRIDWCANH